jgi:predicted PurR-regulated permease PerM
MDTHEILTCLIVFAALFGCAQFIVAHHMRPGRVRNRLSVGLTAACIVCLITFVGLLVTSPEVTDQTPAHIEARSAPKEWCKGKTDRANPYECATD